MSLRKSPILTPALIASNRRNAKQSIGPKSARGRAWLRLNRLKEGWHSSPGQLSLVPKAFVLFKKDDREKRETEKMS